MGNTHAFHHRVPALSTAGLATSALVLSTLSGTSCSFLNVVAKPNALLLAANDFQLRFESVSAGVFCENGLYEPEGDRMWDLSRIFLMVSLGLGSMAAALAWAVSTFLPPTNANWKLLSLLASITAVLQVPVFLLFEALPCTQAIDRQECRLAIGSGALIASTVCWVGVTLATQCLDPPLWAIELSAWKVQKRGTSRMSAYTHPYMDIEADRIVCVQPLSSRRNRWAFWRKQYRKNLQPADTESLHDDENELPEKATFPGIHDNRSLDSRVILRVLPDGKRPGDDVRSAPSFEDLDSLVDLAEAGKLSECQILTEDAISPQDNKFQAETYYNHQSPLCEPYAQFSITQVPSLSSVRSAPSLIETTIDEETVQDILNESVDEESDVMGYSVTSSALAPAATVSAISCSPGLSMLSNSRESPYAQLNPADDKIQADGIDDTESEDTIFTDLSMMSVPEKTEDGVQTELLTTDSMTTEMSMSIEPATSQVDSSSDVGVIEDEQVGSVSLQSLARSVSNDGSIEGYHQSVSTGYFSSNEAIPARKKPSTPETLHRRSSSAPDMAERTCADSLNAVIGSSSPAESSWLAKRHCMEGIHSYVSHAESSWLEKRSFVDGIHSHDIGSEYSSSSQSSACNASRRARQARIRRLQGYSDPLRKSPSEQSPSPSDHYSYLIDSLDLQLIAARRPVGVEYGNEEASL